MIVYINVLILAMMNLILGNTYCTLIIIKNCSIVDYYVEEDQKPVALTRFRLLQFLSKLYALAKK